MIPPKLVKTAASVLCQPLPNAINNSLSKGIFPDDHGFATRQLLLIRIIYRTFDQLVFQRSQEYMKELLKIDR